MSNQTNLLRESVKFAQVILDSTGSVRLQDDGLLGPKTLEAYKRATPQAKAYLEERLKASGLLPWREIYTRSMSRVRAPASASSRAPRATSTRPPSPSGTSRPRLVSTMSTSATQGVVSRVEMERICTKYDSAFSLPRGTLIYILERESGKGPYRPSNKGGSGGRYLGLFQFYDKEKNSKGAPYAWGVARAYARRTAGMEIGALSDGWNSAEKSAAAAAAYAAYHSDAIRKLGRVPTPALLYAAHQQGIGWLSANLSGNRKEMSGVQSAQTVREISQLVA